MAETAKVPCSFYAGDKFRPDSGFQGDAQLKVIQ